MDNEQKQAIVDQTNQFIDDYLSPEDETEQTDESTTESDGDTEAVVEDSDTDGDDDK